MGHRRRMAVALLCVGVIAPWANAEPNDVPGVVAPQSRPAPELVPDHSARDVTPSDLSTQAPSPRPAAPAASPVPQTAQRDAAARYAAETAALEDTPPDRGPTRPRRRIPSSCTADGLHCIGPLSYLPDVCRVIWTTAAEAQLDPYFFARLIWRESLFDPYAISPAGALGIAQFIPSTAALRDLDDPFNPAEALRASAHYLRFLRDRYGNLGLAAGAYNGGEARMSRYVAQGGTLPGETRAYVHWITGHRAETWRENPPRTLDLKFTADAPFPAACVEWARAHKAPSTVPGEPRLPWAMVYAAHSDRDAAVRRADAMRARFPSLLGDADPTVHRTQLPGSGRVLFTARLDTESRMTASRLCTRLRRAGGGCMVLRK